METYSAEISKELSHLTELATLVLPGRADGRPPSLAALLWFFLNAGLRLWRERGNFDIVHFGDLVLFPLAYWNRLVAPASANVVTVHGLDLIFGRRSGCLPALYGLFVNWARGRQCVDHFIANSRNTAKIARGLGLLPVTAIPLGVTLGRQIEPRLDGERRVLFLGRVVRRKGVGWFVKHVLPQLPADVRFDVVGSILDRGESEALKANPRATLWGYCDDAAARKLKARASVMVMPNLPSHDTGDVEGFGLVALEAAAAGIPLVAAETEGLVDAVRHGETGFLAPAGDAEAWARQIMEVLDWDEGRRRAFAERAAGALALHYSWSRVAEDTLAIYRAAGHREPSDTRQAR